MSFKVDFEKFSRWRDVIKINFISLVGYINKGIETVLRYLCCFNGSALSELVAELKLTINSPYAPYMEGYGAPYIRVLGRPI